MHEFKEFFTTKYTKELKHIRVDAFLFRLFRAFRGSLLETVRFMTD